MVRGRPRKRARNTAGLQNQAPSKSTVNSTKTAPIPKDNPLAPSGCGHDGEEYFNTSKSEMSEQDMVEGPTVWGDLEDDGFGQRLAEFVVLNDPNDAEWIPVALRWKKEKKGEKSQCKAIPWLNSHYSPLQVIL